MSIFSIILKEIKERKTNFIFLTLSIALPIALFVTVILLLTAMQDEIRRITVNMGSNILIIPKQAVLDDYYAGNSGGAEMPEKNVYAIAGIKGVSADHYIAKLQQQIKIGNVRIILTGVLPEQSAQSMLGKKKKPMGFVIDKGRALAGSALAERMNLKRDDKIAVSGRIFKIHDVLKERGSIDDYRLYVNLSDAQEVLGKKGMINAVEALGCYCYGLTLSKIEAAIRKDIDEILPDMRVVSFRSIASARVESRGVMQRFSLVLLPVIFVISIIAVGILSITNVNERKKEIGIFMSTGMRSSGIIMMFAGKLFLSAVIGALLGYLLGTITAIYAGPKIVFMSFVRPDWTLILWSFAVSFVVTGLAGFIPVYKAVSTEVAVVLRET